MSDRLFHLLSDLPMLLLVGGGLIVVVMRRARLSGSAVPAFAGLGAWAAAVALSQAWTQVLRSSLSRADAAAMAAWVDGTILALYGAGLLLLVIGMSAGRPPADPAPWTQQPPGPASWGPVPPGPMPPPGPAQPSEWARPPSERPHS